MERVHSKEEEKKNMITTSITWASVGLLNAYAFGFSLVIGLLGGALFGAATGFRVSRRPPKMRFPWYLFRQIMNAVTFFVLTSAIYAYFLDETLNQSQKFWATIPPMLGIIVLIITVGRAIASLDELQRRIQTEAIALAFAGTAIFVGVYALFQFAGLDEVNIGVVFIVMALMWLLTKMWTMWKYR
ncbi:MAG: hypothetical protein GY755_17235 [Chloroflexi bacterium]|nr:hypothetical protein [Chloroflexota bacterium]